jgi:hypothetical protein
MRFVEMTAAVILGLALASPLAEAATITQTLDFMASHFASQRGTVAVKDPMHGSFTFTLDDTKSYTDVQNGLTWHTMNMSVVHPIVFSYDPQQKLLTVGANGHASQYIWGTNDFTLAVYLGPQPNGAFFGYSLTGHNDSYETYNVQVSAQASAATRAAAISAAPLPGSVLMLLTALALLTGVGWVRARSSGAQI